MSPDMSNARRHTLSIGQTPPSRHSSSSEPKDDSGRVQIYVCPHPPDPLQRRRQQVLPTSLWQPEASKRAILCTRRHLSFGKRPVSSPPSSPVSPLLSLPCSLPTHDTHPSHPRAGTLNIGWHRLPGVQPEVAEWHSHILFTGRMGTSWSRNLVGSSEQGLPAPVDDLRRVSHCLIGATKRQNFSTRPSFH